MVEVKKLVLFITLVVLVMILAGSSATAVSDAIPVESDIPDNKAITSQTKTSNSSAGASITITMYAVAGCS